ncbi:3-hydroxyacyl-ACP dehydratase FabZ [Alcaligenes endophyticus]|uniref:3-hydroxyacyl-[acyl-carrier-protein] dehydratase FabZ n=1 Tax=Alcaligenes endophyticus TaxID=1929088 RepID=A0ABT8EJL4_9BURK|nr:3-hydroxyacyl-ACP dehydratase FabZ [Alcaligenes endophyticus]MCX5591705.1 3-hydroxyacyl-ACP dehydratase FabZ [Alcaligenes endophyticus]MDN4121382.1 3-hydroxyacyl-ACP dehydratase FabZ [Alcaligenes endophyticus]
MELDIRQIMDRLPHRYPMLLVDRVLEMVPGKSIVALKNVSMNEPFFTGHFPHHPVMPGVLIIEAMAQAAAIFSFADPDDPYAKVDSKLAYYLVGVDGARFRKPVVPGDQLRMEVSADRISRALCKYTARALVDGQVVAEAKLMCAIRQLEE